MDEFLLEISKRNTYTKTSDTPKEKKVMLVTLLKENLVERIDNGKFRLTNNGFSALDYGYDNWLKKSQEIKNVSIEKESIELELAKENLKEFPKIKLRANIGLGIAIILAIVQLIQWIIKLTSN
ncbi:MAG: hypothetical protein V7655_07760 [Aequorivita antarctica]